MAPLSSASLSSIVFSGHMIDLPDRKVSRFEREDEPEASQKIEAALRKMQASAAPGLIGIASAARGGDIIFHERCRHLGIPTQVILPLSPEEFIERSVSGTVDPNWEIRFRNLWEATPKDKRSIVGKSDMDPFIACNNAIMEVANRHTPFHLIALWDGQGSDGQGGTIDLIQTAARLGDQPTIITLERWRRKEVS